MANNFVQILGSQTHSNLTFGRVVVEQFFTQKVYPENLFLGSAMFTLSGVALYSQMSVVRHGCTPPVAVG